MRSILLCLFLFPAAAVCQESRASVTGIVTDQLGAAVPRAKVVATNTSTGTSASAITNDSGTYDIPYLLPGPYRVTIEMAGFKKAVRDGIELRVNDRIPLDFTLAIGDVAESVTVSAEAPLLESTSASVGMVLDERRVTEFPVVGGNPFYLARLSPGVLSSGGRSAGNPMDVGAATDVIVNGTRGGSSEVMVDGSPNMTNRSAVFSPPQDLVQEIKVQTATFDASIGHAAGAMTNVNMKSGTNDFHGTAFLKDSRIRAVPWFTNRFLYDPKTGPVTPEKIALNVPTWLHQLWGATVTGPVILPGLYNGRNRTHWTFGYDGLQIIRNLTFTGTVPTLDERRGDFSSLLRLGANYQIYDPATIQTAPNGRFSRQPLPGNIIPASRLDPVALNLLKYYPDPNQPGTADGRDNYFRTRSINRYNRTLTSRLDHSFSEKNRIMFRWNTNQHDNQTDTLPGPASGDILDRTGWGAVLDDVHVVSSNFLINLRYGITYLSNKTTRRSQGFDLASLGFSPTLINEIKTKNVEAGIAFPEIVIDGSAYSNLGANGGTAPVSNYHNAIATITHIVGSHSLRYGAEFRWQMETNYAYGNVAPRLEFAQAYTRGPLDTSPTAPIGQGLASMLFGIPTGGRININASSAQQSTYSGFFIQDDWRLSSKLTLNIGLRYEYESPTTERYDRSIRDFDFDSPSPVSQQALANYAKNPIAELPVSEFKTLGGLRFVGAGGQPRGLWRSDRNNLSPRFGFAYTVNKRTVLRGGYGIFYDVIGIDRIDVNQGGFSQPTNVIASLDNGLTYRLKLTNPFPDGLEVPPGNSQGLNTFLGRGVTYFYEKPLNPYNQRWALSLQQELPARVLVEAAYVGNRGVHLSTTREFDPVPRQYLSTSPERDQATIDHLAFQTPNPFSGIPEFTGTGRANVRIRRDELLRPNPHFSSIGASISNGTSWYHSLQVRAEKRMSQGLTFQSSWTWSKLMQAITYLNDTDPRPQRVISDQDYTHRFAFNAIWEVPVGRGHRLLGNARGFLQGLAGGWQFQGWYEGQTGDVLNFGNIIFRGDLKNIPIPVSERRAERWFNVDAGFERDSRNALASNIRTFPSYFSGIRADGINNFDLPMFKNYTIKERYTIQFRMETFNTLNHVQFDAPNTGPYSTAFGTITAEKGHGQRQVTFGLKLLF
jgi:hypothetical protein